MVLQKYVRQYDEVALTISRRTHQERIDSGIPHIVPEAEARALLEQYTDVVMDAKDAMEARGVPRGDFPQMFNVLLRLHDAARRPSN